MSHRWYLSLTHLFDIFLLKTNLLLCRWEIKVLQWNFFFECSKFIFVRKFSISIVLNFQVFSFLLLNVYSLIKQQSFNVFVFFIKLWFEKDKQFSQTMFDFQHEMTMIELHVFTCLFYRWKKKCRKEFFIWMRGNEKSSPSKSSSFYSSHCSPGEWSNSQLSLLEKLNSLLLSIRRKTIPLETHWNWSFAFFSLLYQRRRRLTPIGTYHPTNDLEKKWEWRKFQWSPEESIFSQHHHRFQWSNFWLVE